MIDVQGLLKKYPNGTFATKEGDNIKLRVFQYLFGEGNKVYFCTGNNKDVFEQIKQDENVAFCAYPADYSEVLSICGKAVFVDDISLKKRTLDENPMIKNIFESPENPVFEIFYVDVKKVEYFHAGETIRESR